MLISVYRNHLKQSYKKRIEAQVSENNILTSSVILSSIISKIRSINKVIILDSEGTNIILQMNGLFNCIMKSNRSM